jgi:large subunit ribosomal protein L5
MARLLERYRNEILPNLAKGLGRDNPHALPRLMGVGKAIQDSKILDEAAEYLAMITGQKPMITRSRKSISQFKLREGMPIGCAVTLRGARMYEFLDRLITLVLPRVRDFRGLNPKAFDGRGNYSLGLSEQMVFPEVNADKVKHVQGMNIAIVTTARNDEEGRTLLREFGMPFRKELKA